MTVRLVPEATSTVRDAPDRDRYEIVVDDEVAGFSEYRQDGDRIVVTHTEVDDAHGGQGLGSQLVTEMLADLARREVALVPECRFVRQVIADDPDTWLDLVPEDERRRFDLPS